MYEPGERVGRFEVVRVLGEGATSVVCEVDDGGVRRALKVLGLRSSELKKRMAREGALVQRLDHPNIARLYEVLEVKERPALLLELVEGGSLQARLAERSPVDRAEADRITRALLDAVEHAHGLGVVHRDLKPGNVLLTPEGVPKVVDFGLAKATAAADSVLTAPGMLMGTPAYAAPEQLKDARTADERADVWSLGCLLYELYCGRRPFQGKFSVEVMSAAARGAYVPPEEVAPDVPPGVARAIRAALVPDPEERAPDVATLRRLIDGRPAEPRDAAPVARMALMGGAVGLALLVGAAVVGVLAVVGLGALAWALLS